MCQLGVPFRTPRSTCSTNTVNRNRPALPARLPSEANATETPSGFADAGMLVVLTAAPDGFPADHGRLVQIVAPHLAGAIDAAVRTQIASRVISHGENPAPRELRLVASR